MLNTTVWSGEPDNVVRAIGFAQRLIAKGATTRIHVTPSSTSPILSSIVTYTAPNGRMVDVTFLAYHDEALSPSMRTLAQVASW